VRGIERAGGKVSGVVTEQGSIACSSVVLAGGAWSNLFCGNLGIDLPQLRVKNSVMRTEPIDGLPEVAMSAANYAFRKRLDGGYTIADGDANDVDIVPDSFRYFGQFQPALRSQWKSLRLHFGGAFFGAWKTPRRWSLDEVTPFERTRVLDPEPNVKSTDMALKRLIQAMPGFAAVKVAQCWAGTIDVTPDAVPVISPVDALPGFFIATGFSGHGFGIGPGAGKLAADLVTGARPVVDPTDFRFSRFSDGSPITVDGL
jgi:glycine/D-amino acid oxidase-like deaminating enzyme